MRNKICCNTWVSVLSLQRLRFVTLLLSVAALTVDCHKRHTLTGKTVPGTIGSFELVVVQANPKSAL